MKIAVLDDYQDVFRTVPAFARLHGHEVTVFRDAEKDPDRLAARLQDAEVVVLTQQRCPFPRALVERLPRLRLISQTGSHTDHFDAGACTERGILISGKGKASLHSTAEMTWALILASLRHIPCEVEELKRGVWQATVGTTLHGKALGIYAYGKIGSMVAAVGRAFGMRVICWGRANSCASAASAGYEVAASRAEFFAQADVLSLHLPLHPETRGIVTGADLALMKPTALLVNTSRAGLVEDGALAAALKLGRPGRAAVDVYESEPVTGADHPLLHLPNALCTPHSGYNVRELYEVLYEQAIANIVAFASGHPANIVNPEVLARRA